LSSGNLNAARHLFRAGAYVLFLAGSLLLIRWTFDVNPAEIVVQKLSSMVPSTALVLVTAGAFLLALLHEVEIDGSQFPLSPSRSGTNGRTFCRGPRTRSSGLQTGSTFEATTQQVAAVARIKGLLVVTKTEQRTFLGLDEFAV